MRSNGWNHCGLKIVDPAQTRAPASARAKLRVESSEPSNPDRLGRHPADAALGRVGK
jgi:hypothetical protein